MVLCACGGGSEGTGGITIEGSIASKNGEPLEGVEVIVEETGDSDVSDEAGSFSIRVPVRLLNDILLRFRRADIDATYTLMRLGNNTVLVQIIFEYDSQQRRIDARMIDERTDRRPRTAR